MVSGGPHKKAMSNMVRFTAWLSPPERDALRKEAQRLASSENYVIRMLVREGLLKRGIDRTAEKPERV